MNERKYRKNYQYKQYAISLVPYGENEWRVNVSDPSAPLLYRLDLWVGYGDNDSGTLSLTNEGQAGEFESIAECLYEAVRLIKALPEPQQDQLTLDDAMSYIATAMDKSVIDNIMKRFTRVMKKLKRGLESERAQSAQTTQPE